MGLKEIIVLTIFGFYYFVLFHSGKAVEEDILASEHSVKTIKNAFGDIFDCVDIYKQPAFGHPLLKNHTIQMKPTALPQGIAEGATSEYVPSPMGYLDEKCPMGFVPIMRISKKLPTKSMSNFKADDIINVHLLNNTVMGDVNYVADIRMVKGEYYGSTAELNVWGFPQISRNQFSCSAIRVTNNGDGPGSRDQINGILAGWMVNPSLFGDTRSRLFIYWTADGFKNKGCFNLRCPGFVQVNPSIPLGIVLAPVSTYNGTQYVLKILVFKDPNTENWWLVTGEKLDQFIGYWPKSIFSTLVGHANEIRWGGTVYTSHGEKSPPMGSGRWPREGYGKACFFGGVRLVIKGNVYVEIREGDVLYYQSPCYEIGYFQPTTSGRFFHFGGPGGC